MIILDALSILTINRNIIFSNIEININVFPIPALCSELFFVGVKGIVTNEKREAVEGAEIHIIDRDHPTKTTHQGEYWRLLLPGIYHLTVCTQLL